MDDTERIALKAACIQAAAILVASHPQAQPTPTAPAASEPDTGACARYVRDLFGKLTGEPWD